MSYSFSRALKMISLATVISLFTGILPLQNVYADPITHSEYDSSPLRIVYDQNSTWGNYTQGQYTVTNESTYSITSWSLAIAFADEVTITDIWNADNLTTGSSSLITISCNSAIGAGSTYSFGMILSGSDSAPSQPVSISLISVVMDEPDITPTPTEEPTQTPTPAPTNDFSYAIFSGSTSSDFVFMGWKSYITGDVYSGKDFSYQGSELYMSGYARTVGSVRPSGWTTSMSGSEEGIEPISMPQWGDSILARNDILYSQGNISLDSSTYETTVDPTVIYSSNGDITITGNEITINRIIYAPNGRITINANNVTVNGRIVADEVIYSGSVLSVTASDHDLDFINGGEIVTPTLTATPTPEPTITPYDDTDTDGDYLPDNYELTIGTDPNNPDSDYDGIPDGIEYMMGYDPISCDSDNNGVVDGDEDYDNDGLSNSSEIMFETRLGVEDSDSDGISDGEEIYIYHTDPTERDSDVDGIIDGDEILLGKNPANPADGNTKILQTKIESINNTEDSFINGIEVSISVANRVDRVLSIKDMYNIDVYSTDVVGRKGSPVGFECEESFDTATIVFYYDDTRLGNTSESDLGVLWFDEEHGLYITQGQAVVDTVNNTISLEVTHFSTYVVVDLEEWNSIEPILYDIPTSEKHFDYIFAVDTSYAVTSAQRYAEYMVFFDFLSHMSPGDRISIGYYSESTCISYDGFIASYEQRSTLNEGVSSNLIHNSLYGTHGSYYQALRAGRYASAAAGDIGNEKQLIIVTPDTETEFTPETYMAEVEAGGFDGITLALVTYKDQTSGNAYGSIFANYIGADFYNYGDYGDSLWNVFNANHSGSGPDWSDLDGDGIPDFMEEQGMLLSNGQIITTSTSVTIGSDGLPIGYDSDGDTLSDGEELGTMYTFTSFEENGQLVCTENPHVPLRDFEVLMYKPEEPGTVYVFAFNSDPNNTNTDGDNATDEVDATPKTHNEPINYILYYDDPMITHLGPYNDYISYFEKNDLDYYSFKINNRSDFSNLWSNMTHEVKNNSFTNKILYSYVDNLILIFHGADDAPMWSLKNDNIYYDNIVNDYVPSIGCKIHNLDLQMCYNAHIWNENDDTFAELFVKSPNIDYVYGTPDKIIYDPVNSVNVTSPYDNVETNDESFYRYSYEDGVVSSEYLGFSLPIMYRIED